MIYSFISEDSGQVLRLSVTEDRFLSEYLLANQGAYEYILPEEKKNPEGMKQLFSSLFGENLSRELKQKVFQIARIYDAQYVKGQKQSEKTQYKLPETLPKPNEEEKFVLGELQVFCEENEIEAIGINFDDFNVLMYDQEGRQVFFGFEMSQQHESLFLISKYRFVNPLDNVIIKRFSKGKETKESSDLCLKHLKNENLNEGNRIALAVALSQIETDIPAPQKPKFMTKQDERNDTGQNER